MEDMSIISERELQNSYKGGKQDRKPTGDDPIADQLMKYYYLMQQDNMLPIRIAIGLTPFLLIFLFSILISSTTSNLIAFTALVISLVFIGISFWILCWILDKDPGSRAM